ncbi:MAG: ABC transporter ATP-binding protein, partial [Anaerolineae bacterium]|nr:ABC transporter ATP-binding protein [Anaerolineae bacterium]
MPSPLLQIRDATKIYYSGGFLGDKKSVVALDNFNMTIDESPATITTIAGESGSGKTTLANLVLGFIKLTSGKIIFEGEDITDMSDEQLKEYRRNVQAVFQDPFGVYNPFYRIDHIFDLVNKHFSLSDNQSEYRDMVEAGLNVVGLYGEDVLRKYPHQLSGGQRQRIMMARAYMIKPRLIVADEPVSMVDASLRASILDAMLRLRDDHNISFLYITHDLSTAYQIGDQIYMLYQGTTAERGAAMDVIDAPQHPYVQLLIDSVPVPDPTDKWDVDISLPSEEEMRTAASKGCRYYPRCPHRMDKCLVVQPPLFKMEKPKHEAACYLYEENEIAPIEPPMLVNRPITEAAVASAGSRTRERLAAAVLVVIAFVAGALIAFNREPEVVVETVVEEVIVVVTATPVEVVEEATTQAESEIVVPDFTLSPDGATAKGALTLNVDTVDEITEEGERHVYTFVGMAGQEVTVKLVTGGAGLSGTGFFSPFGTVLALGDNPERPGRSHRETLTLPANGAYQVVIGPYERVGIEGYTIVFEGEAPEIFVPEFTLSPDGATAKGALTLNVDTVDEITAEDERHVYTFAGVAGQEVTVKLVTGGAGLSGTGFFSPFGTV